MTMVSSAVSGAAQEESTATGTLQVILKSLERVDMGDLPRSGEARCQLLGWCPVKKGTPHSWFTGAAGQCKGSCPSRHILFSGAGVSLVLVNSVNNSPTTMLQANEISGPQPSSLDDKRTKSSSSFFELGLCLWKLIASRKRAGRFDIAAAEAAGDDRVSRTR